MTTNRTNRLPTTGRIAAAVTRFLQIEAAGGIVLLAAAIIAIAWANSPWSDSYHELLHKDLSLTINTFVLELTLHGAINDGLMAVFFFLVGIEIKRELVAGELRGIRAAALPVAAALGGMVAPALIYYVLEAGSPGEKGWGIPMATDIAFAVGFMSLLGSRVPKSLVVFLLAFAIADDLGAIIVIAVFYTEGLSFIPLILGVGGLAVILLLQRLRVRPIPVYIAAGILIWLAFYESGVHPTVAGVLLAFLTPMSTALTTNEFRSKTRALAAQVELEPQTVARQLDKLERDALSPLDRIEDRLHLWVAFGIMPLFALANAGVTINRSILDDSVGSSVAVSVALALVVGKPLGVILASWITSKIGLTKLPANCNWGHIVGVGVLGGIGFTVALFIADLSFDSPTILDAAKLGIIAGSTVAALLGLSILMLATRRLPATATTSEINSPRL